MPTESRQAKPLCSIYQFFIDKSEPKATPKPAPKAAPKDEDALLFALMESETCINIIAEKWLHYNNLLKFKPEVPLTTIIESFSMPIQVFIRDEYPALYDIGPKYFWTMLLSAIQKSGYPSPQAVETALRELSAKAR
jgi:hypothetical protein